MVWLDMTRCVIFIIGRAMVMSGYRHGYTNNNNEKENGKQRNETTSTLMQLQNREGEREGWSREKDSINLHRRLGRDEKRMGRWSRIEYSDYVHFPGGLKASNQNQQTPVPSVSCATTCTYPLWSALCIPVTLSTKPSPSRELPAFTVIIVSLTSLSTLTLCIFCLTR